MHLPGKALPEPVQNRISLLGEKMAGKLALV